MVTLTGTYRDPGLAEESYTTNWLVTNAAGAVVASGFGTSFGFVAPDDAVYTATFTVTNAVTGLASFATTTVTTSNVSPTGTFAPPAFVGVNESIALTVSDPFDPSPADAIAGLHFAFDINGDGTIDVGDGTYAGSPASNATAVTFATLGPKTVAARVIDKNGGFTDYSQTFVVAARPAVQTVQINDGATQRSRVTSLTVTFDSVVDATALAPAFVLRRQHDSAIVGTVSVGSSVAGGKTVAVLTFGGANTEFSSLADGRWKLEIDAAQVTGISTGLALAANFASAEFHRMFGDGSGNRAVNNLDLAQFRTTQGLSFGQPGYHWYYDFNGTAASGTVNNTDLGQLRLRFGTILP